MSGCADTDEAQREVDDLVGGDGGSESSGEVVIGEVERRIDAERAIAHVERLDEYARSKAEFGRLFEMDLPSFDEEVRSLGTAVSHAIEVDDALAGDTDRINRIRDVLSFQRWLLFYQMAVHAHFRFLRLWYSVVESRTTGLYGFLPDSGAAPLADYEFAYLFVDQSVADEIPWDPTEDRSPGLGNLLEEAGRAFERIADESVTPVDHSSILPRLFVRDTIARRGLFRFFGAQRHQLTGLAVFRGGLREAGADGDGYPSGIDEDWIEAFRGEMKEARRILSEAMEFIDAPPEELPRFGPHVEYLDRSLAVDARIAERVQEARAAAGDGDEARADELMGSIGSIAEYPAPPLDAEGTLAARGESGSGADSDSDSEGTDTPPGGEEDDGEVVFEESFEDGLDGWDVQASEFGAGTPGADAPAEEAYSGDGVAAICTGNPVGRIATAEFPEAMRIREFTYVWLESQDSFGGGVRLLNEDGDVEVGAATDNPEWVVDHADGVVETGSGDAYGRWIRTTFRFDWSDGSVEVEVADTESSTSQADTYDLKRGTNVGSVELRAFTSDRGWENTSCCMAWDGMVAER